MYDTSMIPDDPASWERLARRIERAARSARSRTSLSWLAGRSSAVLTAAAAAIIAAIIVLRAGSPRSAGDAWIAALGPADAVGQVMNAAAPPSIGAVLLARRSTGEGDR